MAKAATAIEEAAENRYWREELARELLALQVASGLPLGTFAKQHGILPERLRRWHRKLAGGGERDLGGRTGFLPVRVIESISPVSDTADTRAPIELIAGGRVVRVTPGFCEETLLRLVQVLESAPC